MSRLAFFSVDSYIFSQFQIYHRESLIAAGKAFLLFFDILTNGKNNFDFDLIDEQCFITLGNLVVRICNKTLSPAQIDHAINDNFIQKIKPGIGGIDITAEDAAEIESKTHSEQKDFLTATKNSSFTSHAVMQRLSALLAAGQNILFQNIAAASSQRIQTISFTDQNISKIFTTFLKKLLIVISNNDPLCLLRLDTFLTFLSMTTCKLMDVIDQAIYDNFTTLYLEMLRLDRSANQTGIGTIAGDLHLMTKAYLPSLKANDRELVDGLLQKLNQRSAPFITTSWKLHPKDKDLLCLETKNILPDFFSKLKTNIAADEEFHFPLSERAAAENPSRIFLTISIKNIQSKALAPSQVQNHNENNPSFNPGSP